MKKLKLSKSSWYGLCLFMMALLLAMTPFVATAATFTVDAQDEFFDPDPVSISVGDTVHWVRTGAEIHTVDSGGYNTGPCSEPNFGGVILLNHLDTYDHTFITPGPCGAASAHAGRHRQRRLRSARGL